MSLYIFRASGVPLAFRHGGNLPGAVMPACRQNNKPLLHGMSNQGLFAAYTEALLVAIVEWQQPGGGNFVPQESASWLGQIRVIFT